MTGHDQAISVLIRLPAESLVSLGSALQSGTLRHGFSQNSLSPFCGAESSAVEQALRYLISSGFSVMTAGVVCQGLGRALSERDAAERSVQLVLSGPEVVGTPVVDTKTTVLSLFDEAQEEVLITSYVFHDAAQFFARLAEKHDANPNLRITFVVDISHTRKSQNDLAAKLCQDFAANFRKKHWPGKRVPELWHDPRCFDVTDAERGILHAKTVIVDRKVAFVTSANFTGAAQSRNIEAGVLLRQPRVASRLHAYFSGLIATNSLRRITW